MRELMYLGAAILARDVHRQGARGKVQFAGRFQEGEEKDLCISD